MLYFKLGLYFVYIARNQGQMDEPSPHCPSDVAGIEISTFCFDVLGYGCIVWTE